MTGDQSNIVEQLAKLAQLHADGAITDEEFAALKSKLIAEDVQRAEIAKTAREPLPPSSTVPPVKPIEALETKKDSSSANRDASKAASGERKNFTRLMVVAICMVGFVALVSKTCSLEVPSGDQPTQAQITPNQFVRLHAPSSEQALFNAHATYKQEIDAPNDIIRNEISDRNAKAWQSAVLRIGHFERWAAYVWSVSETDDGAKITFHLDDDLSLTADVSRGSALYEFVRVLSDNGQEVYISGSLTGEETETVKSLNPTGIAGVFPSCFETGLIFGCNIDLLKIELANSDQKAVAQPAIQQETQPSTEARASSSPPSVTDYKPDVSQSQNTAQPSAAASSNSNEQAPESSPTRQTLPESTGAVQARPDDLAGAADFNRGDFASAFTTLSPLANQGDAIAQFFVGVMYLGGHGTQKNPALAVQLLYKSATSGIADAQNYMAAFYRTGRNAPLDYATAMRWYLFAAKQNYKNAQYHIALMYRDGLGVQQDNRQAYMWACIAATGGPPEAIALRARLQQELTAEESAQAEHDATAWLANSLTATPLTIDGLTGAEPVSPTNIGAPASEEAQLDVVKRFYGALAKGDGLAASLLVVPEKRVVGPFSALQLTRYYSNFRQPLRVNNEQASPLGVAVHYSYVRSSGASCVGFALVKIDNRGGAQSPLIAGIKILSGNC